MGGTKLWNTLTVFLVAFLTKCHAFSAQTHRRALLANTAKAQASVVRRYTQDISSQHRARSTALFYEGAGKYYGETDSSVMVKDFSLYEQLEEIVKLAAMALPERPDGIVCVVKFSSATREDCVSTEASYERLARANTATVFLRCFEEFDNADLLFGKAQVISLPTFDIFYGGNRVARVEGPQITELENLLDMYQFQNTKLDLFSEEAEQKRALKWGDGKQIDYSKTPRTTARFIPGYDWDKDKGFFDDLADKAQDSFNQQYGEWVPDVED
mmetsp:Transcript_3644/g.6645  ORF Transcript_3644/g.6645 Transcript_3644/m.6645 type:complete len:271 (-) Transcript_3644:160-972(-)